MTQKEKIEKLLASLSERPERVNWLREKLLTKGAVGLPASPFGRISSPARDRNEVSPGSRGLEFSFIFFADGGNESRENKYQLVLELARYADEHGFRAIWVPERHFHPFGGIYPDPGALCANLAGLTRNIRLRAGSVVLPLYHPARVAETWSMIDNLSGGRVDLAFASGWNPHDFVLAPETYPNLRDEWLNRIPIVQQLWRGEEVSFINGRGEKHGIVVYPRPLQRELPVWLTATRRDETFIIAGERGYNVLTMLQGISLDELGRKIQLYRDARQEHGLNPKDGIVTLMLHTFVHPDTELVRTQVRDPFFRYIKSALSGHLQAKKGKDIPNESEIDEVVEYAYERYYQTGALFGTPVTTKATADRAREVGVNEIACLMDFGVNHSMVLQSLPYLGELKDACERQRDPEVLDVTEQAAPACVTDHSASVACQDAAEAIAVIGMCARFAQSPDLKAFWDNLSAGRELISTIPESRWQTGQAWNGESFDSFAVDRAGLLDQVECFDARFFRIAPREAQMMDPHQRLFMEIVWACIEDAGYSAARLSGSETGLFVAMYNPEFAALRLGDGTGADAFDITGMAHSMVANRLSYYFNFHGPSEVIDTACSSSLVALHRAVQSIRAGECTAALVGGVSLLLGPQRIAALKRMGILARDGRSHPFNREVSGEVVGEGVGALLIKPLSHAIRDRDHIYGLIRGSAVNHHGNRSGTLTLPSADAQTELIAKACANAQVPFNTISYIEAHGAGGIGDSIELEAFVRARGGDNVSMRCAIGSLKPNVGFLEAAGGISQLIKTLLMLQHRQLLPTLNHRETPEELGLDSARCYINTRLTDWEVDSDVVPRRASVHAYGLGGTNAHVILEEFSPNPLTENGETSSDNLLFVFSARTPDQLKSVLNNYCAFLEQSRVRLRDLAFTLQVGRQAFAERAAIVAADLTTLRCKLRELCDGGKEVDQVFRGNVFGHGREDTALAGEQEPDEVLRELVVNRCWEGLARLWTGGATIDWEPVMKHDDCRRLSLPTYPFSRDRFPLPTINVQPAATDISNSRLEPLVVRNNSDLQRNQFEFIFHGHEYFLADHVVAGQKVLPGAVHIEMALVAGRMVVRSPVVHLKNVVWTQPVVIEADAKEKLSLHVTPRERESEYRIAGERHKKQLLYSQGVLSLGAERRAPTPALDISAIRARCPNVRSQETCYRLFEALGQKYGPSFQSLLEWRGSENEAFAELRLPGHLELQFDQYILHPSLFDGALQTVLGLFVGERAVTGQLFLPFAVEEITLWRPIRRKCFVHARESLPTSPETNVRKFDFSILDEEGGVLVSVYGFCAREWRRDEATALFKKLSDDLLNEYVWIPSPLTEQNVVRDIQHAAPDKRLILYLDGSKSGPVVLPDHGETIDARVTGEKTPAAENSTHENEWVDLENSPGSRIIFDRISQAGELLSEVVFVLSEAPDDWDPAVVTVEIDRYLSGLAAICSAWAGWNGTKSRRVVCIYPFREELPHNPLAEALSGFLKSARKENPGLRIQLIGIPAHIYSQKTVPSLRFQEFLRLESAGAREEDVEVCYRADGRWARRLRLLDLKDKTPGLPLRESGVYWITGGLGGLGLTVASAIASRGCSALVLSSRSQPTAKQLERIKRLEGERCCVTVLPCDVGSYEQVLRTVSEIGARHGKLDGILHAAGVLREATVAKRIKSQAEETFRAKVLGAINIDRATRDLTVDFIALFSSVAGFSGQGGFGDYAYANRFLDSYAENDATRRRQNGRSPRIVSISWPLWREGGMVDTRGRDVELEKLLGVELLDTEVGIDALGRALQARVPWLIVLPRERRNIQKLGKFVGKKNGKLPDGRQEAISGEAVASEGSKSDVPPPSASRLAKVEESVKCNLIEWAAEILGLPADAVEFEEQMMDYGFNSIGLTELANAVNKQYFLDVSPAVFFEHTTLDRFWRFLCQKYSQSLCLIHRSASDVEGVPQVIRQYIPTEKERTTDIWKVPSDDAAVAIVGVAGILPDSRDLDTFWSSLCLGKSLITEVPSDRWDWRAYYGDPMKEPGKTEARHGGFIPDVDKFDPEFFGISLREANLLDPQHRLVLETVWQALADASIPPSALSGTRTGVYVGVASSDYGDLLKENGLQHEPHSSTGYSHSVLANRVSYLLNLHGPSEAIDTACSSSLVAIHRAVEAIRTGRCELALAGGVNVLLNPELTVSFDKAGMLSHAGVCKPFADGADGYVRSEGVGILVLKQLRRASVDRDPIYAIIRGSAVNHGGHAASLTAPNPRAQADLLIELYRTSGVDFRTVSYIEAHGTGTRLGDPVEIEALKLASAELDKPDRTAFRSEAKHCAVGSVKSFVGHLEAAAGVAGMITVLLCLKYKTLLGNPQLTDVNPLIDLRNTPLKLMRETGVWEPLLAESGEKLPRRAGVSSFGFGGTNAHIILEEFGEPDAALVSESESSFVIPLAAKDQKRLRASAAALVRYLEKAQNNGPGFARPRLRDFAYTLQIGRELFREARMALVVTDYDELLDGLKSFLAGKESPHLFVSKRDGEPVRQELGHAHLLADSWTNGEAADWVVLYREPLPRRIHLPGYSFGLKRCWFDGRPESLISHERLGAAPGKPMKSSDGRVHLKALRPHSEPLRRVDKGVLVEQHVAASQISEPPEEAASAPPVPQMLEPDETTGSEHRPERESGFPSPETIQRKIRANLAEVLYLSEDTIDPERSFAELGLDSILGVELIRKLNEGFQLTLEATRLYDAPNIDLLTKTVYEEICGSATASDVLVESRGATSTPQFQEESSPSKTGLDRNADFTRRDTPVVTESAPREMAIVGMAGRFPGADNLELYWENLKNGIDSITEIPRDRWDVDLYYDPDPGVPGKTYSKWGGFLHHIDRFDPLFFHLSPEEADWMDPQQRLFLEEAWHALEDAGYSEQRLQACRCGVYAGVMGNDYQNLLDNRNPAYQMLGNSNSILATRIAYYLNLKGPVITVDTACSSSLVALHLACGALTSREADLMLVGGVTLYITQLPYIQMSKAGMLAPDGRCKSFDQRANGIVPGEGVGVVVLKRLDQALRDNDRIYGVIKGSGINQDGRTNGLTAPSSQSQEQLYLETYDRCGVSPERISYVEAHGTGTQLGDPVEIHGLTRAFREYTQKTGFCALGSVKSNIGHTTAAAGMAGLLKVLLSLTRRQIPPSLHFEQANEHCLFEGSPFYVNTGLLNWETPVAQARYAAVSAFGFSGTNAHVVIEEAPAPSSRPVAGRRSHVLLPFTGKTAEQLDQFMADIARWLTGSHPNLPLEVLAYTLLCRRTHFTHRIIFLASNWDGFSRSIQSYRDFGKETWVRRGCASSSANTSFTRDSDCDRLLKEAAEFRGDASVRYQDILLKLADYFVAGYSVDWSSLFPVGGYPPVSLPGYPFSRERCWIRNPAATADPSKEPNVCAAIGELHHLPNRTGFSTRLTAETPYIADHNISGRVLVPGVVYLELAIVAGERIASKSARCIRNILWNYPCEIIGQRELIIQFDRCDRGWSFSVQSADLNSNPNSFATGLLIMEEKSAPPEQLDLSEISLPLTERYEADACYEAFAARCMKYGPSLRGIRYIVCNGEEALARIELPPSMDKDFGQFRLHPCVVEYALQAVVAFLGLRKGEGPEAGIPIGIDELIVHRALVRTGYSYIRCVEGKGAERRFDVQFVDEAGEVLVTVRGFRVRLLGAYGACESDTLFFAPEWIDAPRAPEDGTLPKGSLILFDQDETIWRAITESGKFSDDVILIKPGEGFSVNVDGRFTVGSGSPEDYGQLTELLREKGTVLGSVLYIWPRRASASATHDSEAFANLFCLTKALTNVVESSPLSMLCVLQNDANCLSARAVSGFFRSLIQEYPNVRCKSVLIGDAAGNRSSANSPICINTLFQELKVTPRDSLEISCSGGKRRTRRLGELGLSGKDVNASPFQRGGLYWVLGGNGSLGGIVAEYLAKRTLGTVVLSGRSEPGDRITTLLAKLESLGARAAYLPVDLSDREDTKQTARDIRSRFGPMNGIVHCAGGRHDALLTGKTLQKAKKVLFPKVDGVLNLDEATRDEPLDFLMLFSSLAAVMGNPGQVDYAYANAFLDQFAVHREALRLGGVRQGRTISVNWPYWADGGMKVSEDIQRWMEQDFGLRALPLEQGLTLLEELWRFNRPQIAVFHGVSSIIRASIAEIDGLSPVQDLPSQLQAETAGTFVSKERTIGFLCDAIAENLRIPAEKLDSLQEFANYGIDSISVMGITRRLESVFGRLRKTLFFEYKTIDALADYFIAQYPTELARWLPPANAGAGMPRSVDRFHPANQQALLREYEHKADPGSANDEGIAIIGLSGRYAMANNLDSFWENLRTGRDCITEIPVDRWDKNAFYDPDKRAKGKSHSKWGGFLDDIDKFDPLFFNISPREAESMDPQERLFLETAWHVMEVSGYRREDLEGRCVGVYVGVMQSEYGLLKSGQTHQESFVPPAVTHASIANRVSYFLNLRGPSFAIDTFCSSSLTAVHLACESLRHKECQLAIAGGVNLSLHPNKYLQLSQGQFISSDGRCRSFGAGGDGYVPSEGVGAVLLKPIGRAIADRDRIYGVIVSSVVNHSGRTNGFFVPDPRSQEDLVFAALKKANVNPRTIGYLEAHGTGTALGDPIEVEVLTRAFATYTSDKQFCAIGSVKSNIGHAEAAAGIGGLTKVLLQMQYRQLVPSLHCDPPNPDIEFAETPFYVQRELATWTPATEESCLRAGLSSFGAGGTNVHLIVESFEPVAEERVSSPGPNVVLLSAKTEEGVKASAQRLADFLQTKRSGLGVPPTFEALCHTLQTGREGMKYRLAIVASGVEELCDRLRAWLNGRSTEEGVVVTGKLGAEREQLVRGAAGDIFIAAVLAERDLPRLAQLWVMGAVIDWNQLYESGVPQKVSLPGYCFARERYWFGDSDASATAAPASDSFRLGDALASPTKETPPSQNRVDGERDDGDDRLFNLLRQLRDGQLDIEVVEELIAGGSQ